MARDTRTGGVLELMILPALERSGYRWRAQVAIGDRLGCGRHFIDVIAEKDGREVLISVKWQQVPGTAEQKVPFEVICLLDAIERGPYQKAYVVLGGEGWKLCAFYVAGGLKRFLAMADRVEIVTLETFIARANDAGCRNGGERAQKPEGCV